MEEKGLKVGPKEGRDEEKKETGGKTAEAPRGEALASSVI